MIAPSAMQLSNIALIADSKGVGLSINDQIAIFYKLKGKEITPDNVLNQIKKLLNLTDEELNDEGEES
jgi:hypothetical protein